MTNPSVSIILTAFNRREYLHEALTSVIDQDLPKGEYEVIVSKNFEDRAIDSRARSEGFRLMDGDRTTAGTQIASALDFTSGRIITFLDDDDTWLPSRLRHVVSWFRNRPDLSYYANTYSPVDEEGRIVSGKSRDRRALLARLSDARVENAEFSGRTVASLDHFFHTYPGNNSSIAVSRDLLVRFQKDLSRVRTSIDHFLVIAALLQGGGIVIEHLPLTHWRMHPTNTSDVETSTLAAFRRDLGETVERIGSDNRVFLEMANRSGNEAVSAYLRAKLDLLDELGIILRGGRHRAERVRLAWTAARSILASSSHDYWSKALVDARIVSALSQPLALAALYLFLQGQVTE